MTGLPNILIIEDDEDDYCLACDLLSEAYGQDLHPDWEATWEGGMVALHAESHDVYLIDYRLGARDGLDLVRARDRRDLGELGSAFQGGFQGRREVGLREHGTGPRDPRPSSQGAGGAVERCSGMGCP